MTEGALKSEEDILADFDEALHGVHIISSSFVPRLPLLPFFKSSSGIGSFHAMQLGVPVVFSAGNNGPDPSLVGNVNPWSICVAASTIDRRFPTKIMLDDIISFTVIYQVNFVFKPTFITKQLCKVEYNSCCLENSSKKVGYIYNQIYIPMSFIIMCFLSSSYFLIIIKSNHHIQG